MCSSVKNKYAEAAPGTQETALQKDGACVIRKRRLSIEQLCDEKKTEYYQLPRTVNHVKKNSYCSSN